MKNKDVNHKNNSQFSDFYLNYLLYCDGLILITCSIKKSFLNIDFFLDLHKNIYEKENNSLDEASLQMKSPKCMCIY